MLKIFNTLTRNKQEFVPIDENRIGIYVCGMTVYDYCHIGHARVLVMFDIIARHLRRHFTKVCYVRNITDIDDKIIKQAIKNQEDIATLTARFTSAMHEDERALDVLSPDIEPRATDHIDDMLYLIQKLMDKKLAYQAMNGDIYFSTRAFSSYGKLSAKNLDELKIGARVDVNEYKKDVLDFVLWKASKEHEPSWRTSWGPGRPGWHIECSAMSMRYLGHHFDIHGGGMDLIFPHHENEIAQSQSAHETQFANYWMHLGFVNIKQKKMSKSIGNFVTIRNLLKKYSGETLRYFIISSHYRSPLNYSEENLIIAENTLRRLYLGIRDLFIDSTAMAEVVIRYDFKNNFIAALDDDFNTPVALSILFDLLKKLNQVRLYDLDQARSLAELLRKLGGYLGILQHEKDFFKRGIKLSDEQINQKIMERNQARKCKNFILSDAIRDELAAHNIILEDTQANTTWRCKY